MPSWPTSTIWRPLAPTRMKSHGAGGADPRRSRSESFSVQSSGVVQATYHGSLRIMLPDTFGTTQFLENAPDWAADWTGQRIDSKDPYVGGDEYIQWLKARAATARQAHHRQRCAGRRRHSRLHAYFGGTLANGVAREDFRSASDFMTRQVDARPPHSFQRRLGNAADQRFSRLRSAPARFRPHQPDLQGIDRSKASPQ